MPEGWQAVRRKILGAGKVWVSAGELSLSPLQPPPLFSTLSSHVSTLALPSSRHTLAMRLQCGGRQCEQCVQTLIISRHRAKFSRDLCCTFWSAGVAATACLPTLTLEWVHLGFVFIFYLKILPILGMESWARQQQQTMASRGGRGVHNRLSHCP